MTALALILLIACLSAVCCMQEDKDFKNLFKASQQNALYQEANSLLKAQGPGMVPLLGQLHKQQTGLAGFQRSPMGIIMLPVADGDLETLLRCASLSSSELPALEAG